MRYFNAIEASKILNISDKTVRRWCKKGKIVSKRTEFNEIAIPEDELERIRAELDEARSQLRQPGQPGQIILSTPDRPSAQHTHPEIDTLTHELGKWQAKVDILQAKYEELERRISELEAREYPGTRQNVVSPPVSLPATQNSSAVAGPLSASTTRKNANTSQGYLAELPPGTLGASDFAKLHGVPTSSFLRWLNIGLKGEMFDVEKRPRMTTGGKGDFYFFLTPGQQKLALGVLRRHGKIK